MSRSVPNPAASRLPLHAALLRPGLRLAVGVSGGADSVALLCALAERAPELGIVLHAAHLHHGLRGAEADEDQDFVRQLAQRLNVPLHETWMDVAAAAKPAEDGSKPAESIEEAARRVRYGWFRQLMAQREVDAVATAHTLDDQVETVLAKFLRGAWTEGLSGIHPELEFGEGRILRPLLSASRVQVIDYLRSISQDWREDSSNRDLAYTRNRIRHELLPMLEEWNPQLRERLAQMAELAREEDHWWTAQVAWLAPQVLLPGRPVRGGGRAASSELAVDCTRLAELAPAMQRRVLRYAAAQLGTTLDFAGTEALRALVLEGRAGQKRELAQGLRAERTHRELRFELLSARPAESAQAPLEYGFTLPGEVDAPGFGLHLRVECGPEWAGKTAVLRNWAAGDRVRQRYTSGPRKVKEVLERLRISGSARGHWPVLDVEGTLVWMKGIEVEPMEGVSVQATETSAS